MSPAGAAKQVVDQFWHEIADYLNEIETLYEARQTRKLLAVLGRILASRVARLPPWWLRRCSTTWKSEPNEGFPAKR